MNNGLLIKTKIHFFNVTYFYFTLEAILKDIHLADY
jgi:hypothetical protein